MHICMIWPDHQKSSSSCSWNAWSFIDTGWSMPLVLSIVSVLFETVAFWILVLHSPVVHSSGVWATQRPCPSLWPCLQWNFFPFTVLMGDSFAKGAFSFHAGYFGSFLLLFPFLFRSLLLILFLPDPCLSLTLFLPCVFYLFYLSCQCNDLFLLIWGFQPDIFF